jgi:HTH-type transcriptional regulator/antitoxin HigA
MKYRPIKSLAQYKSYESYLEKGLWIKNPKPADKESIDLLIALIKEWDANHGTVSTFLPVAPAADPIERLAGLMKTNQINPSDLASAINISQSAISDILNYKKELSEDIISRLSQKFAVDPEIFCK